MSVHDMQIVFSLCMWITPHDVIIIEMLWLCSGVCVQQASFSVLGTSVSLQTECVTAIETAPLEQMKLFVQVKVQIIIIQHWLFHHSNSANRK